MFYKGGNFFRYNVFVYSVILLSVFCQQALSQGLPTELMDLSFEDINTVEIGSEITPKTPLPDNIVDAFVIPYNLTSKPFIKTGEELGVKMKT